MRCTQVCVQKGSVTALLKACGYSEVLNIRKTKVLGKCGSYDPVLSEENIFHVCNNIDCM